MENRKISTMKKMYVDIGELGWSIYLSAHLRWLRENTDYSLAITTLSDRKCLYKDSANLILDVPHDFHKKFKGEQNCFGLGLSSKKKLKEYFRKMLPSDYSIPEDFDFGGGSRFLLNKVIYKPYKYSKKLEGKKKILIFPRCRKHPSMSYATLPRSFYIELIKTLCDEFPSYEIKTRGLNHGAYSIWNDEVRKSNYRNGVREKIDLQDTINECQLAIAAVGGISSLPRISLLQKVPTFVIGHQKKRLTEDDNWLKTKVGFYEVASGTQSRGRLKDSFTKFNFEDCIDKIVLFINEINK